MPASRIIITIDPSRLEAFAEVTPGEPAGEEELGEALRQAGVKEGLDTQALGRLAESLARESFTTSGTCIAVGREAEDGEAGFVEFDFDEGLLGGTLREDGSFDLRDRKLIKRVDEGQVFAHYRSATPGCDGLGVDGNRLAARPGDDRPPELGPGVESGEGGAIRARREGVVFQDGNAIDVVNHFVHQGHVDLQSGDLDMDGSITVTGEVQRNATVRATGDVVVQSCVDGGCVVAAGSVEIARGLVGGESGSVSAGADVHVAHVWNARVQAGARIEVGTDCMNAKLIAQEIEVGGRVLGGELYAERRIEVRQAGAAAGAGALLAAAMPLPAPGSQAEPPDPSADDSSDDSADEPNALEGKACAALRLERKRRIRALRPEAVVVVTGEAFPGVTVCIGDSRLTVDERQAHLRFAWDEEQGGVRIVADAGPTEDAASG